MRGIPGVAGRTFSALGREGVNIIAIAQGSSEYNISLVVEAAAMQRALAVLHKEFRLDESAPSSQDALPRPQTATPEKARRLSLAVHALSSAPYLMPGKIE